MFGTWEIASNPGISLTSIKSCLRQSFLAIPYLVLLLALGCLHTPPPPDPKAIEQSRARFLIEASRSSELVESSSIVGYLNRISLRLTSADQLCRPEQGTANSDSRSIAVYLMNARTPFALTDGSGTIIISSGLAISVRNEAEMAFVIAHETAHTTLNDQGVSTDYPAIASEERSLESELAADKRALACLAKAGYDLPAALGVLRLLGRSKGGEKEIAQRYAAGKELIKNSRWTPPGTVNRRDFRLAQLDLAQSLQRGASSFSR